MVHLATVLLCEALLPDPTERFLEILKYLQTVGCDRGTVDDNGDTAAMFAAMEGHLEAVKYLHSMGCDLESRRIHSSHLCS